VSRLPLRLRPAGLALLALLLGACSLLAPRPDVSRYFVLGGGAPLAEGPAAPAAAGFTVGLGPVRLAEYLRRPELLTRTSETEIRPSRRDRWAEPLDAALPRVLAEELARGLDTPRVALHPWFRRHRPDFQIVVDVLQFERDAAGAAVLAARWEVRELADGGRRVDRESRFAREPGAPDTPALVAALHATLVDLAGEIAAAVGELAASAVDPPSAGTR
jgi:uncharacterized lipoprotein YmbA